MLMFRSCLLCLAFWVLHGRLDSGLEPLESAPLVLLCTVGVAWRTVLNAPASVKAAAVTREPKGRVKPWKSAKSDP